MRSFIVATAFVAILFGWFALRSPEATASRSKRVATGEVQPPARFQSELVDSGFVIVNGRYFPPPYLVELRGSDLVISGQVIRVTETPVGAREYSGPKAADRAADVQRWLRQGCLLFARDERLALIVPRGQTHWLLLTLGSVQSPEYKLEHIEGDENIPKDPEFWSATVREFEPSDALRERVQGELGSHEFEQWVAAPSPGLMYALNVGGMALVVLAFGALLGNQPRTCQCHSCTHSGDGSSFLMRNVALIVLLSAFDLGCTLLGTANGIMSELNPLADSVIHSPVALSAFKLTATFVGAGILIGLRRHQRAQLASWWVCLFCSLLAFRWVSFHSLFMA